MSEDTLTLNAATWETTVESLPVRAYANAASLAEAAAAQAGDILTRTLAQQDTAAVILATGQTQLAFLDILFARSDIDWSSVVFFHMDEYLGLPRDHPASFRHYLHEKVESRIQSMAFHYLDGSTAEPASECARYQALLKAQPIDLCFLGIGNNGHLAFNDPDVARFDDPYTVKIVKLDEICRQQQVDQGHFPSIDRMPQYALTLTPPTLCSARQMMCLASGSHKADIVKTTLEGPVTTECPASILRQQSQATLLLDDEASRLIRK